MRHDSCSIAIVLELNYYSTVGVDEPFDVTYRSSQYHAAQYESNAQEKKAQSIAASEISVE